MITLEKLGLTKEMMTILLDYNYFKDYYKMTEIDSSKQQTLDIDPKAMQQINFTRNLA